MSPSEAGRPGEAVAQLGQVSNDAALAGIDLETQMKQAQKHVDSLAAQNDLAKVYANTQDRLAHTQNSRDVEGVIKDANNTLNDVSARWSTSPASIQIQQSADALRPDLSHIGTVKQVDLMGKEFKVTISQQAEVLTGSYAADRASGGSGDMALGAFSTAVHGGVTTGLIGDVEAQDMVRQFRQSGQELQIKNGISNANPEVNTKIYNDITQHPEKYPDVTPEQLDVMKGQALSAFEAHTKQQDWAEGQMALKQVPSKINQFTNPATGRFDIGRALEDNADRFAKGEITETQSKVFASGFDSYDTEKNVEYRQQAEKLNNEVVDLFHQHKYQQANVLLEQHKNDPVFEDHYESLIKYGDQIKREDRVESLQERTMQRQKASEDSLEVVAQLGSQTGYLTKDDIPQLMTQNPGLKYSDALHVVEMRSSQQDPYFQSAMDVFKQATNMGPGVMTMVDYGKAQIALLKATQPSSAAPNGLKGEALIRYANDLVKPNTEKEIGKLLDAAIDKSSSSVTSIPKKHTSTINPHGNVLENRRTKKGKIISRYADGTIE